jgi:PAS domain S-box-containing protein
MDGLAWADAGGVVRARQALQLGQAHPDTTPLRLEANAAQRAASGALQAALLAARDTRRPFYSRSYTNELGKPAFSLFVPLLAGNRYAGMLSVEVSVEALLRHHVPDEVARRHLVSVVDEEEITLATTSTPPPERASPRGTLTHDVVLSPVFNGLQLRGEGWRTSLGLVGSTLFWMVVAMALLTVWMLVGTARHMRRRSQIQRALLQETQFRRAMENSMVTGMRALDLEGRITYVNAAFCQMSGFSEAELVGSMPPYPYWPSDRVEENHRLLQQEMQGRNPAGGIEVQLMRKDGRLFDVRMYVSPLIDPRGQQTGWMTSVTNITEAKRIRDQLAASHERFTTVLEGLDASVSVLSVHQGELLFANRSYRLWFGADARGHGLLAGQPGALPPAASPDEGVDDLSGLPTQELTDAGGDLREVYAPALDKWFEVRSRYLQWTDGSLAQMLIATDISARRRAEAQAEMQAAKAAVTSRLMTMGEMASTVAHELNQPLTAITNYCNGMLSRLRAGSISQEDLGSALAKTARQAERAGQIIHRIRAFVKKSEPQRQPTDVRTVVEEAVDLAGIELRRRNVAIRTYLAQRLPLVMMDPILIEQVLLNLLKNAAEAIDSAQLPASRRHVELRVVPRQSPEEGEVIEFSVTDAGPGLREEVVGRLYEAFFSTKAEGLGIGLNLCRSIVESHQGRMRAQNLYNGSSVAGCTFSFTLPMVKAVQDEVEPGEPANGSAPSTTPTITLP